MKAKRIINRFLLKSIFMVSALIISCSDDTSEEIEEVMEIEFTDFTPQMSVPGGLVTITGTNFKIFEEEISVTFGENVAEIVQINETSIRVKVPENVEVAPISITTTTQTLTSTKDFHVLYVDIKSAKVNDKVNIHGLKIGDNAPIVRVLLNELQLPYVSVNENQILVEIVPGSSTGELSFEMGTSKYSLGAFEVIPRWSEKMDFPGDERSSAIAFGIGDKFYVGLGITHNGGNRTLHSDFWEYDPSSNSWTQKADFPGEARMLASAFSIGDKGYVGMGTDLIYPQNTKFKDLWEYNPNTDSWSRKADLPSSGRAYCSGFTIGNKGYIGLGTITDSPYTNVNDFWSYDPSTDSWTQMSSFPGSQRHSATAFVINGKAYVGGGAGGSSGTEYLDFYEFDPSNAEWNRVSDIPKAQVYSIGFTINDRGYAGLGVYSNLYEYVPVDDIWIETEQFPFQMQQYAIYSSGGSAGTKGYVFLGKNDLTNESLWSFE